MKIFIFEDDLSISLEYEMILEEIEISDYKIFKNIKNSNKVIINEDPDLVILDVHLKDGISLDLLPLLNKLDIPSIVITAYPDKNYAQKAFDYQVETFLSKPVNSNTLKFEIKKIQSRIKKDSKTRFVYIMGKNKFGKIKTDEIEYIETDGNYTSFITKRKKHVVKKSLTRVMNQLKGPDFCRVFRNLVINVNFIKHIDYTRNIIITDRGEELPLGKTYKKKLKELTFKIFNIL